MDKKRGSGHIKVDTAAKIPVNMELLSHDNRVGFLLVIGGGLVSLGLSDLFGWGTIFQAGGWGALVVRPFLLVFGVILVVLSGQRLLIPGCKSLLRINFGGVTDIRLVKSPIRWSLIENVRRPYGIWFYLLPGVILEMKRDYRATGLETIWSRLIHWPSRLRGGHVLFLECGTLDQSAEQTLMAIRSHLQARPSSGRR